MFYDWVDKKMNFLYNFGEKIFQGFWHWKIIDNFILYSLDIDGRMNLYSLKTLERDFVEETKRKEK